MNKAIKYRLYPTTEQAELFIRTFGCCRKVYNLMLSDKIEHYNLTGKMLNTTPAQYKKDFPFLKEVDSLALANVQLHLQSAFSKFFREKNIGFPKFKSAKRSRKSYTTNNQNGTVAIYDKSIRLPKFKQPIKARIHRKAPSDWIVKSATVFMESDGKFYVSVLFEYDSSDFPPAAGNTSLGLDYKSDGLFVDSNGKCCMMPHYYRESQKKLAKQQRKLRHMTIGSRNYQKQQKRIASIHCHIANQRKDFLHKASTEIANQYKLVCVENLNMKAMSNKGFGNGKATLDNGYGMFLDMIDYKLSDRGGSLVKVDKWFPSSQICSRCGQIHPEMKNLNSRTFTCDCGFSADRDFNAAINILNEGLRIFHASV